MGTHLGLGELEVPFAEQKRSLNPGYDGSIHQLSNPHLFSEQMQIVIQFSLE